MDGPAGGGERSSSEVAATMASLPSAILEDIACLCSPVAKACARRACRLWRSAFGWRTSLQLYSQRPACEAARLSGAAAPPFPRASCARLMLATSAAACSQTQLDAWMDALRQRTAITHLTLSSAAAPPSPHATLVPPHGPQTPPSLARLAPLQHLRALVLGPLMSQANLEAAAVVLPQLILLTRLRFTAPCSKGAAATLAASLRSGLPHLTVLKLCLDTEGDSHHGPVTEVDIQGLVQAAAAGAPLIRVLVCRVGTHPMSTMRAIEAAFGLSALQGMRVLIRGLPYGPRSSFRRLEKAAGSQGGRTVAVGVAIADMGATSAGGAAFQLCAAGLTAVGEKMQREGLVGPPPTLESLSLTVTRHERDPPALDLSVLPASLWHLDVRLGAGPPQWPLVCGAAPSVRCLEMTMDTPDVQPLPLAALVAACPRLYRLGIDCDMQSGAAGPPWDALSRLSRLAELYVDGLRYIHPQRSSLKAFPAACFPSTLVQLHLCDVRVQAAAQPPSLGKLRELCVTACFVEDFRVFSKADGVRRIETWDVTTGLGAEALLHFQELEYLHDRARDLSAGLFTVAAEAAAQAAGNAAAFTLPILPRLHRLKISSPKEGSSLPCFPEGLLADVPLRELHIDTTHEATEECTAEWLRPFSILRRLAVLEVSGPHAARVVLQLHSLLPLVVAETVAE